MNARLYRVRTRRGSFLVFVVGVLALLAVITVAYVTVGRADRRSAATVVIKARQNDVPDVIREYVLAVIKRDLFLARFDFEEAGLDDLRAAGFAGTTTTGAYRDPTVALRRRETFDYPSSDLYARSDTRAGVSSNPFTSLTNRVFDPAGVDSDPWLSFCEPEWINADATITSPEDQWPFKRLDWMHTSNFAPDGRSVNLYYLRGDFDAKPRELSHDGPGRTRLTMPDGTTRLPLILDGGQADADAPWQWNTAQVGAFQPIGGYSPPFGPGVIGFDDPTNPVYQWADADGDGMLDTRWFEPVWAGDSRTGGMARRLLPADDEMRWVCAIRAIDLSGLVNVNTATDLRVVLDNNTGLPTSNTPPDFPLGLTPGDVDLRRILSMQDWAELFKPTSNVKDGPCYADLRQPERGTITKLPNDYWANIDASPTFDAIPHILAGEAGYDELRKSLLSSNLTVGAAASLPLTNKLDFSFLNPPPNPPPPPPRAMGAEEREFYGREWGPRAGSAASVAGSGNAVLVADGFGVDSLLELLTRRGVNDPRVTSPLESVLDGRGAASSNIGPMRSNRLDYEEYLNRLGAATYNSIARPLLIQSLLDPRQRITTLNGTRRLVSFSGMAPNSTTFDTGILDSVGPITAAEQPLDIVALFDTITRGAGVGPVSNAARHRLFEAYADALLPYADKDLNPDVWRDPINDAQGQALRTLHYGHRGPELALLAATHMTVNMLDMADADTNPTGVTLLLDNGPMRTALDNDLTSWSGNAKNRETSGVTYPTGTFSTGFSLWGEGRTGTGAANSVLGAFDLNSTGNDVVNGGVPTRNRLADVTVSGDTVKSPVRNIYGIEPQPILTEVASFFIYTDAPVDAGGDGAGSEFNVIDGPGPGQKTITTRNGVTIDGRILPTTNPDFIAEIIAFQIHNPFDEPVTLTMPNVGPGGGTLSATPRYYIQFAGRFFDLASLSYGSGATGWAGWSQAPTTVESLDPGETRVFWAIGENPAEVQKRIDKILAFYLSAGDASSTPNPSAFHDWIVGQLTDHGLGPAASKPILLPEVDPRDRSAFVLRTEPDFFVSTTNDELMRVAQLWRRHYTAGETENANAMMNDQLVDRLREPDQSIGPLGSGPVALDQKFSINVTVTGTSAGLGADITDPLAAQIFPANDPGDNTGLTIVNWASIRRPDWPAGVAQPRGIVPSYMLEVKKGTGGARLNEDDDSPTGQGSAASSHFGAAASTTTDGRRRFDTFFNEFGSGAVGTAPIGGQVVTTITKEPKQKTGSPLAANLDNPSPTQYYNGLRPDGTILVVEMPSGDMEPWTDLPNTLADDQLSRIRVADLLLPFGVGPEFNGDPALTSLHSPYSGDQKLWLQHLAEEQWTTLPEALAYALGYCDNITPEYGNEDPYYKGGQMVDTSSGTPDTLVFDRGHLRPDAFVPYLDLNPADNKFTFDGSPPDVRLGDGVPLALNILSRFTTSRDPAHNSLTRAERGLININTASIAVLRALPMLSPPVGLELDPASPVSGRPLWWWDPANSYINQHTPLSDIATAVAAFRDRLTLFPLDAAGGDVADTPVVFGNSPGSLGGGTNPPPRQDSSQIDGISNRRGFTSVGELLAVRDRAPGSPWQTGASDTNGAHDIDRLGWNLDRNDVENLETIYHKDPGGTLAPDEIIDDYDEKLTIINAVLGSTTTRSDYFAVWFLIHGYRRADVEGLGPNDPMVPSVARRFLMVVDRSNVVNEDDEPRVVLFEELPL